ncbi:MAG: hypothetical protein FJ358_08325 [Thaumarchaeota archaeon]|nr:hypothetical protein [Nitrososphaerota archaeon]
MDKSWAKPPFTLLGLFSRLIIKNNPDLGNLEDAPNILLAELSCQMNLTDQPSETVYHPNTQG